MAEGECVGKKEQNTLLPDILLEDRMPPSHTQNFIESPVERPQKVLAIGSADQTRQHVWSHKRIPLIYSPRCLFDLGLEIGPGTRYRNVFIDARGATVSAFLACACCQVGIEES